MGSLKHRGTCLTIPHKSVFFQSLYVYLLTYVYLPTYVYLHTYVYLPTYV